MPQEITAFKADDGSIHEDACSAAMRDITLLVERSPIAENKPYAREVVAWLMSDPENIALRLTEFRQSCPNGPKEEAPRNRGEGPVVSQESRDGD